MRLYLIRHGQSENNIQPDFEKHFYDPSLTELGIRQAEQLANHLKYAGDSGSHGESYGINRIYTSPMKRALQTTAPIARALNLKPQIWVATHERGGIVVLQRSGVFHERGMTRSEIAKDFPTYDIPYHITDAGWWRATTGLETHVDVANRARIVADDLLVKATYLTNLRVALISHGTFLHHLMQVLLNDSNTRYITRNAAISRIDIDKSRKATLAYVDHTPHF